LIKKEGERYMKFFKKLLLVGILIFAIIPLACSDDGENQGDGPDGGGSDIGTDADSDGDSDSSSESEDVVTTLDGTKVLNALSDAEVTQLCDDIWAYFETTIGTEIFCKYKGLSYATSSSAPSDEALRANCTGTETTCLGDPATAWSGNPGCSDPPDDCAATVADYSTCIRDVAADFIQQVSAMPTCDMFTSGEGGTSLVWDFKGAERLPSCIWTNCTLWPPDPKNI
jgi:hypothetical protein